VSWAAAWTRAAICWAICLVGVTGAGRPRTADPPAMLQLHLQSRGWIPRRDSTASPQPATSGGGPMTAQTILVCRVQFELQLWAAARVVGVVRPRHAPWSGRRAMAAAAAAVASRHSVVVAWFGTRGLVGAGAGFPITYHCASLRRRPGRPGTLRDGGLVGSFPNCQPHSVLTGAAGAKLHGGLSFAEVGRMRLVLRLEAAETVDGRHGKGGFSRFVSGAGPAGEVRKRRMTDIGVTAEGW